MVDGLGPHEFVEVAIEHDQRIHEVDFGGKRIYFPRLYEGDCSRERPSSPQDVCHDGGCAPLTARLTVHQNVVALREMIVNRIEQPVIDPMM